MTLSERLGRTIGQLIVVIEEKTVQLDEIVLHVQQLETTVADLKTQLEEQKNKVLALASQKSEG